MDFRIDIGPRRSGRTTRMLRQAASDLGNGMVNFALLVFPSRGMMESAHAAARAFPGGPDLSALFDPARCQWTAAAGLDARGVRSASGYYLRRPVGAYLDEALDCMAEGTVVSGGALAPFLASLVQDGLAYFSCRIPECDCQEERLGLLTSIASGRRREAAVLVKRLSPDARMPERAHPDDAGADVFAASVSEDVFGGRRVLTYGTGLALAAPAGTWIDLRARSSVFKTGLALCNGVGTIDAGYRGEVMMKFYADGDGCAPYKVGDRIGQLVVMPSVPPSDVRFVEADELPSANDRNGGFGSTGK